MHSGSLDHEHTGFPMGVFHPPELHDIRQAWGCLQTDLYAKYFIIKKLCMFGASIFGYVWVPERDYRTQLKKGRPQIIYLVKTPSNKRILNILFSVTKLNLLQLSTALNFICFAYGVWCLHSVVCQNRFFFVLDILFSYYLWQLLF